MNMFKIKDKEVRNEIKLAKKVAKNKAKEVLAEAKRIAKETEDKALAKQIVKSAKKYNKEMVKNVRVQAKECNAVEEVKTVIESQTAMNVEKCVEEIKEVADQIIKEKKARKANTFFGRIKRMSKIKDMIGQMFLNQEISDMAKEFIETVSFEKFCEIVMDTITNIDITEQDIIEAMKSVIYNKEQNMEGCAQ